MSDMPQVHSCAASDCAFNDNGCNAFAMTMGKSSCVTFISLDAKGGLPKHTAQVGACQRTDCAHNDHLECQADSVKIGEGEQCLTFQAA